MPGDMGKTAFATGNALTQKTWSISLFRESVKDLYFYRFAKKAYDAMMKGENIPKEVNSIILVNEDLTKKKGDAITFTLRMKLAGEGVNPETDSIEENDEQMSFYDFTVTLTSRANSVKAQSEIDMQRPAFDLRGEFRSSLEQWVAEYIDKTTIDLLSTSPTTGERLYAGSATATTDITSSDTMSTTVISKAKRKARLHSQKMLPVVVGGKEYYVMLMHDYQFKALQAEDAWLNAQKYAGERGLDNPIFSGAEGVWDGVVIHKYERINTFNTWGAGGNLTGARALLLGTQAGVHAWCKRPTWHEKLFEYDTIPGVACTVIWKAAKTVYNSKDFAVITVDSYYAQD